MIRFQGIQMSPAFEREAANLFHRKQVQVDTDGENFNKITNVSNIKKFIEETKAETV